jgi:cytoskeletal protein CcmA (bactofilin family)
MKVNGDCETDGTLRIEGSVQGAVKAGKAVVIGKDGVVIGDIVTQDGLIAGKVEGTVTAHSRLELQASCRIDGEVHTPRLQLEEGAVFNGNLQMARTGTDGRIQSPRSETLPS